MLLCCCETIDIISRRMDGWHLEQSVFLPGLANISQTFFNLPDAGFSKKAKVLYFPLNGKSRPKTHTCPEWQTELIVETKLEIGRKMETPVPH